MAISKINIWRVGFLVLIILLFWGFYMITRNSMDKDWVYLKQVDLEKIETLEKSGEKVQMLFENLHGAEIASSMEAMGLINEPYVPIMEYSKFEKYISALQKEKRIVISTVEGGGATTVINRLANFIAIDQSRVMNVLCSPKFDLIYHKKYIGEEINGVFKKGELLLFWEDCLRNPNKKFVAIFDDIDKLDPETLFGPYIWAHLGNPKYKVTFGGKEITIPPNFYMINTTLTAIGSRTPLHNEHFNKLGKNYYLAPSTIELALKMDRSKKSFDRKVADNGVTVLSEAQQNQYAALSDERNMLEFLFLFDKTNKIIDHEVSHNSQLAQWSNLRKLYLPEDQGEMIQTFLSHVNAISPDKHFDIDSFDPIFYTFKTNGLQKGSSKLARWFKVFKEWGFLTEFVVAICFALITALLSIYFNSKRKKQVTKFLTKSEEIYAEFSNRSISTDVAIEKLANLKSDIEEYTKDNKISFPEAIFFHNSVRSKVNSIEISKNINTTFLVLMDVFMDDDVLSRNEYDKLITFLDKIENTIPKNDYNRMKEQVNLAWRDYGEQVQSEL